MNRTDILSEIKEAENRADAAVSKAEADRKSAVAQARRDSVARIQQARAELSAAYDSTLAAEKEKLDSESAELFAAGEEDAKSVEVSAEHRIKEVVDFL